VTRSLSVAMRSPSAPYVVPFGVFLAFLGLHAIKPLPDLTDQILRLACMTAVLLVFARPVLDFRMQRWAISVLIGVAVFGIWIAPDLLFPTYRQHWLFQNAIAGAARTSLSASAQAQPGVLALRTIRAVIIVPVIEELFWRAWLMRWLISEDFKTIPLGAFTRFSFCAVAVLFASEHGSYWDVGLITGMVYNWWMVRTKNLGDLILTHAVTNACLCAYVIQAGKWEYWL
jgi:CAAX prenyl protease-like protein